ncbi:MAG: DUF4065 domain-containing protein [Alistipes sp.]|nr:DUF4065 domain-containing protein [Alistipes sp.]
MNNALNNSEIGKRIAYYRSQRGLSQEDLASSLGISRPSLTQIEQGNRNVSAVELSKLADILNFSLDEIMSADFEYDSPAIIAEEPEQAPTIRISVPHLNIEKFKNLILYILERCAGKPNIGETVLYKLLYFSDFNYYEIYEEHLSGATYRKLAMGPVPRDITEVLHDMETSGILKSFSANYFGYKQKRYIPLVSANKRLFNGAELDVVDKVIDQLSGMSASEISRYSHGDMPWKASKDRQVIDYELAFYREAPYSVRTYNDDCDD